jgi:cell division protein FtsL
MIEFATLQDTFYIIGIIYMGVMFLLIIALVAAVLVIRNKVISLERNIQRKIDEATDLATKGGEILARVGSRAARSVGNKVRRAAAKR